MANSEGIKRIELTGKRITLSDDDRYRMSTLSAEIVERLSQMGAIMREVGAMSAERPARWVIEFSKTEEDIAEKRIIQVCSEVGNCGCYEDPPGVCYVGCFSGG